jgi:hypothetical protein
MDQSGSRFVVAIAARFSSYSVAYSESAASSENCAIRQDGGVFDRPNIDLLGRKLLKVVLSPI